MSDKAYVEELPQCDFCESFARFDGKTLFGPWAYMCRRHYEAYGIGLGLGRGQKLIIGKEEDDATD